MAESANSSFSKNNLPILQTDFQIPVENLPADAVFRTSNGFYVRFSPENRARFTHVIIENGFLIGLRHNAEDFPLVTKRYTYSTVVNPGTSASETIAQEQPAVIFACKDCVRESRECTLQNGQTITTYKFVEQDIRVKNNEIVPCEQVVRFVTGYSNSAPLFQNPSCDQVAPNNCNASYYATVTNLEKEHYREVATKFVWTTNPITAFFSPGHESMSYFSEKESLMIQEKVKALKELRPDICIGFILTENIETDKLYSPEQLNELAADAVQHFKAANPDKELALLFYNMTYFQQAGYYTQPENCYSIGFAVSRPDLIAPATSIQDLTGKNPFDVFLKFFARLRKPYKIINVYQRYNNEIVVYTHDKTAPGQEVYGSPFIYKTNYLVSVYRDEYLQKLSKLESAGNHFSHQTAINPSKYASILSQEELLKEQDFLVFKAEQELANFKILTQSLENLNNVQSWEVDELIASHLENIRESLLTEQTILSELKTWKGSEVAWLNELQVPSNPQSAYYQYDALDVIDPYVYGTLDALGYIPFVDFIADGVGLLYSSIRGNGTNVVIYSAALATPFVGSYVYKQGYKAVSYFIRKVDDMTYQLAAKSVDDAIQADWIKITDDIPVDESNLAAALTDLNKPENLNRFSINDRQVAYRLARANSQVIAQSSKFSDDILALGDDLQQVTSWISKSDGYYDVIIHADHNGNFSILLDGTDQTLTPAELAAHLQHVPADKTIRLPSCNSSQSAQEIAQILGRDIVGSTGEMKIFDNGLIQGDNWYIARSNGAVDGFTPAVNNLQPTGVFKVLRSGGNLLSSEILKSYEFYGIKAVRIKEGTNGKVAIIGQSMGDFPKRGEYGVVDYARKLREKGYQTELFAGARITGKARDQLDELKMKLGRDLTPAELETTIAYKENMAWAKWVKDEGFTVIDIGNPNNKPYSHFYNGECINIFGN
jgi:hypothetical protein